MPLPRGRGIINDLPLYVTRFPIFILRSVTGEHQGHTELAVSFDYDAPDYDDWEALQSVMSSPKFRPISLLYTIRTVDLNDQIRQDNTWERIYRESAQGFFNTRTSHFRTIRLEITRFYGRRCVTVRIFILSQCVALRIINCAVLFSVLDGGAIFRPSPS